MEGALGRTDRLAVALLVAVLGFRMPVDLALLASTQGFVFGLFPIMWIVLNAICSTS